MFEPFKKGANGEFGIGLSIVKRIVTMHDGAITAENADTGVTFSLTIPV
ncbi:Sensor histidine kinase [Streptococcus pneumoniae]|nr:Sensor histidine kinase [Streptococcus pneumoniae]